MFNGAVVRSLPAAVVALLAVGCTDPLDEQLSETSSASTVSSSIGDGCSTAAVIGLSKQIGDEIGCMNPSALTRFAPGGNLTFASNAVLPYLGSSAKDALEQAAATTTIQINSAFRTVAQQYLLYQWYQQGRCGIVAAAVPGRSNHESGRALDIADYSAKRASMSAAGWSQLAGDPVHFDYAGSPDIRGQDVLAFQRLWNRNNPGDAIAEDGELGPDTEARLRQAPATGFALGASCGDAGAATGFGAEVRSIQGPDRVAAGAHAAYAITVENQSGTDWPSTTRLQILGGIASALHDPLSWTSPSEIGPIGVAIAAGATGVIGLEIVAPQLADETSLFTELVLTDGVNELGTIPFAVIITPNGDGGSAAESDEDQGHDGDQGGEGGQGGAGAGSGIDVTGGCSAGGGLGWAMLAIPAALARRRRDRRSAR